MVARTHAQIHAADTVINTYKYASYLFCFSLVWQCLAHNWNRTSTKRVRLLEPFSTGTVLQQNALNEHKRYKQKAPLLLFRPTKPRHPVARLPILKRSLCPSLLPRRLPSSIRRLNWRTWTRLRLVGTHHEWASLIQNSMNRPFGMNL